jgi:hypothetical protein
MTCPHCHASLKYKERSGSRCGTCKREFAFEPKGHPLALHDERFRRVVRKLSADGTMRFTAEQLRHALARKPVGAQKRADAGCLVAPFVVAAVAAGGFVADRLSGPAGLAVAAAIAAVGVVVTLLWRRRPFYPQIPMDGGTFRNDVLGRWRRIYGDPPAGLVDAASLADLPAEERPVDGLAAVLVCPVRDVLACLLANGVPRRLRVGLLPTTPPFDPWQQLVLEALRRDPTLPVLVLHDASAEGAFLAHDLPLLLRLDPHHRVYDLGLNPKRSMAKKRLVVGAPVDPKYVARLDAELADAAAHPIRRGRARLSPDEIAWLRQGYESPVLAISPASLVKRLEFALDKIGRKQKRRRAQEDPARAIGFLTWPA